MSERTAEQLAPAQAAELAAVIDAQARWENMRCDPPHAGDNSSAALQGRQKAYDAFRTRLAAYTAKYRAAQVPEPTLNTPERVAVWCRAVRAVLLRAEPAAGAHPAHVVAKAYRLAERIAARMGNAAPGRAAPADEMAGAVRALDAVIAWCDVLAVPAQLTLKPAPHVSEPLDKVA